MHRSIGFNLTAAQLVAVCCQTMLNSRLTLVRPTKRLSGMVQLLNGLRKSYTLRLTVGNYVAAYHVRHPRHQLKLGRLAVSDVDKNSKDDGISQLAERMLQSDPETAAQLQRYQAALARVDRAKAAAAELEDMFKQAAKDAALSDKQAELQQRQKADEVLADAEVAAAERRLLAAELELANVEQERARLSQQTTQDANRVESGKAGAFAAAGGALGLLPFLLTSGEPLAAVPLLSFLAAVASCLFFGVTYRYAISQDPGNRQLKGGVVAAFGLVRAAAAADVLQQASPAGPFTLDVIGPAALYAGESMLMFGFAATAVEVVLQRGLVKRA